MSKDRTPKNEQAWTWLDRLLSRFEAAHGRREPYNLLAASAAGDAARLLGFADLDKRAERLATAADALELAHGVRGDARAAAPIRLPRRSKKDLARDFPVFSKPDFLDLLNKAGGHLSPCLERYYPLALVRARTEEDLAEIALAQAVLGDVDAAGQWLHRLPYSGRRHRLHLVLAIELYRNARGYEGDLVLEMGPDDEWAPIHLAIGIAGRTPWTFYPFPPAMD